MPPSPAVVSADLATAALQCQALDHARRLAEWVGAGQDLTARGVPKPAAAVEACRELGIELPGPRLRSALDVDELMVAWVAAVRAGFVVLAGRRARVGPGVAALSGAGTRAHPQVVLDAWLAAVAGELGVPDEPCAGCLTVLHALRTAGRPLHLSELAEAVEASGAEAVAGERCPDCGGTHVQMGDLEASFLGLDEFDEEDGLEHAGGAVSSLLAFGAATIEADSVTLTPLGAMLAASVFEGCAPAPDADARTLLAAIGELPPAVAVLMAAPWLNARDADTAVRELLAFAEAADGAERVSALTLARTVGPEPVAAWRQWAGRPGFGAYARQWLAEHGKPVAVHPEDEAWLIVDAFSAVLDGLDRMGELAPPFPLAMAFQQLGDDPDEVLTMLRESGHPAADEVAARLIDQVYEPPEAMIQIIPPGQAPDQTANQNPNQTVVAWPQAGVPGTATVYQLKISLRHVDDPPVWRRVLVPASYSLGDLHHVIQLAMGWEYSHLHVFSTRLGDYGVPEPELQYADQDAVTLAYVLPRKRSKLAYTYDFGDGWEHDVVVEDKHPLAAGDVLPRCVAGEGACPPEDCGGPWGYEDLKEALADPDHEEHYDRLDWMGLDDPKDFDAAAFSVDEANKRLAPRG